MYRSLLVALALFLALGLSRPAQAQYTGDVPPTAGGTQPPTGELQSPQILDLDSLLAEVRTQNPSLQAIRLGADALTSRREQVASLPDPSIVVGYRPFGLDAVTDLVPTLRMQQAIPFPGKLALAGRAADYRAEAAKLQADAFAEDLALQVKLAYYDLYLVQQHDRHVQHFQNTLADFEQAAAVKYEVGQGAQQAILKAQLERNARARERLMLTEKRRTLIEALARLTDRPELVMTAGEVVVAAPDVSIDTARAFTLALAERPEVASLQAELRGADTEVALAKKDFLPDFQVEAGFMDMGGMNGLSALGNRFIIGGGITIPLQTGRRRAAVEEARLRRAQVEARYAALQTEIETRVNELNNRLREEAKALALYENTLIPQAQTTLEATLSAYTTGQADFLDLLDSERMLFDLHVEKERTLVSYLKGAAELERAIGVDTLSDPLLAQTNR